MVGDLAGAYDLQSPSDCVFLFDTPILSSSSNRLFDGPINNTTQRLALLEIFLQLTIIYIANVNIDLHYPENGSLVSVTLAHWVALFPNNLS